MKNALNYYYNIIVKDIHQKNKEYHFKHNECDYIFEECSRTIEELYELYNLEFYLYNQGFYLHQFMLNKDNEIITNINNKNYVLLRKFITSEKKVDFNDLSLFGKIKIMYSYENLAKNNWRSLWMRKIDYIENQIEDNKNRFKIISENIDYYIGLAENAIQLMASTNLDNDLYLSHKRVKYDSTVSELYNPLNIILDSRVRDISEYYKNIFFRGKHTLDDDAKLFKCLEKYNNNEKKQFFARLLFASSFFDLYDEIVTNGLEEISINGVINASVMYENKLKELYANKTFINVLPEIEWLKKM